MLAGTMILEVAIMSELCGIPYTLLRASRAMMNELTAREAFSVVFNAHMDGLGVPWSYSDRIIPTRIDLR